MANETLILRDSDGTYYQLDRRILDAARVPEDRVDELEEALNPEVTGHGVTPSPYLSRFEVVGVLLPPPGIQHFDIFHADFGHTDHSDAHFDTR